MHSDHRVVVPVLTYHQVEPLRHRSAAQPGLVVDTTHFHWQMFFLRALGYRTLTLDDLAHALERGQALPRRSVVLTFDDGYYGVYRYAFPILRRFQFTATMFLIAEDFMGASRERHQRAFAIIDQGQVAEMLAAGHQIGSHSISHQRLTDLKSFEVEDQIIRSKAIFEDRFGRSITTFSYPYGAYTSAMAKIVERSGYSCAVTTRFGHRHALSERFTLRRIAVGSAQRLPQFVYRLRLVREESV